MSTDFKNVEKFCLCCNNKLKLNNTRDIIRKNFCCKKCNSSYLLKKLWKNEEYRKKSPNRLLNQIQKKEIQVKVILNGLKIEQN